MHQLYFQYLIIHELITDFDTTIFHNSFYLSIHYPEKIIQDVLNIHKTLNYFLIIYYSLNFKYQTKITYFYLIHIYQYFFSSKNNKTKLEIKIYEMLINF